MANIFDSKDVTTGGGLPSIISFLRNEVIADIRKRLEDRRKQDNNNEEVTQEEAFRVMEGLSISAFVDLCERYLAKNRIGEVFAVDSNIGLVFNNLKRCVVCPGTDVAGTTLDSGAVAVTTGRS